MSLSDYEDRVNSNWRGHMEYRAAESKAFADIDAHAKASFENTMRQFAATTAMPGRAA
jgi:tellurite resistance protein